MRKIPVIRTLWTFSLLIVFAFSATPKIFLHQLFARHTDVHIRASAEKPILSNTAFQCDCENLVVDLPYEASAAAAPDLIAAFFASQKKKVESTFHASPLFLFGFRGPPAC